LTWLGARRLSAGRSVQASAQRQKLLLLFQILPELRHRSDKFKCDIKAELPPNPYGCCVVSFASFTTSKFWPGLGAVCIEINPPCALTSTPQASSWNGVSPVCQRRERLRLIGRMPGSDIPQERESLGLSKDSLAGQDVEKPCEMRLIFGPVFGCFGRR
jgi:hypothetical protein